VKSQKERLRVFKNLYARFFHVIWSISQKNAQRCLLLQTVMSGFLTFAQLIYEPTHPSFYFITIILIVQTFRKKPALSDLDLIPFAASRRFLTVYSLKPSCIVTDYLSNLQIYFAWDPLFPEFIITLMFSL
jgi:hypothetical protein